VGCDIHLVTQIQDPEGQWRTFNVYRDCPRCVLNTPNLPHRRSRCWECDDTGLVSGYGTRHYAIFSVLADVRNDDIEPISSPRGLPEDFTLHEDYYHGPNRTIWLGEHSFSWLLLSELEAYDWVAIDQADSPFVENFMSALKALNVPSDQLRIVFGFDS